MRPSEEKHYKKNRENYESLIARLRQCPAFNRAKTKHYCKINGLDAYYDSVTNALFAPFFEISMNGAAERYDLYYNKALYYKEESFTINFIDILIGKFKIKELVIDDEV